MNIAYSTPDLIRLAAKQRGLLIAISGKILFFIFAITVSQFLGAFLWLFYLVVLCASFYYLVTLMTQLRFDTLLIVFFCFFLFVPVLSLIILLYVNHKATSVLSKEGYKIGLFGVSSDQFPKVVSALQIGSHFRCSCPFCHKTYNLAGEGHYQCDECEEEFVFIMSRKNRTSTNKSERKKHSTSFWVYLSVGSVFILLFLFFGCSALGYKYSHEQYLEYKKEAEALYEEISQDEEDIRKAYQLMRQGSNLNNFILLLSAAASSNSSRSSRSKAEFSRNTLDRYIDVNDQLEKAEELVKQKELDLQEKKKRLDRLNTRIEDMKYEYDFDD